MIARTFAESGFVGPVPVLSPGQCALILRHDEISLHAAPLDWNKGRAATDTLFADIARLPALVDLLRPLLGDDIVLWGASIVRRGRGQVHTWHTDIESSDPEGRFVSAWIGLENTSRESTVALIGGSHRLPRTIQEELHLRGLRREEVDEQAVLAIARGMDPAARLEQPSASDGEAILFDGRLWHGSRNDRAGAPRSALLLQYAAAATPVRILDSTKLDWPFRFLDRPRPPAVPIAGRADEGANRVVDPWQGRTGARLASLIHRLSLPLRPPPGAERPWQPHPIFSGATANLVSLGCHASVLVPGHSPHRPHTHLEEELLVVLDGEADLVIARSEDDPAPRIERVSRGAFAYYPAYQHHTIRNPGCGPLVYAMLKWSGEPHAASRALETKIVRPEEAAADPPGMRLLFEQETAFLGKLHAHLTLMPPGGGYAAHADEHDIAIIVLSGRLHTLAEEAGANAVIFYAAGEMHGMENRGREPAAYLVFEFHRAAAAAPAVPAVDREWYLAQYPDVATAGIDPVAHYRRYGAKEGRRPRPPSRPAPAAAALIFDRDWYLANNPDVAAAGLDPLEHYRAHGAAEGRPPCADHDRRLLASSGLFDADWYERRYPDVATGGDPLAHYLATGGAEGRAAGPLFDGASYLQRYTDVREAGHNPLLHYLKFGRAEGRMPAAPRDWNPPPDIGARVARYRARDTARPRRFAVCTAIMGGYDTLMVPDRLDPAIDHVCLADAGIDGYGVWDVRPPPFRHDDPTRRARYVKAHLPDLLPGYAAVAWLDANIAVRGDLARYFRTVIDQDWGIGFVRHPVRACIYDEAEACKQAGRDDPAVIDRQMARYRALGVPAGEGLYETSFFVARPGRPGVEDTFRLWWDEISRDSRRDQLSLGWALRRSGVRHGALLEDGHSLRNHPDFTRYPHEDSRAFIVPQAIAAAGQAAAP